MNPTRAIVSLLLCLAAHAAGAAESTVSNADQRLKRLLERATPQSSGEALPAAARQQMLAAGEAALARGDAEEAAQQFERAGMAKHAADAELGLIRAYMQAGEYRRALAFAAHTAGAHPQISAATVARRVSDVGLAQLHLLRRIATAEPALPLRDPFPGSPGFAVEFPAIANAAPGWPLLRVGFLGKPSGVAGVYQLGIGMPQSHRGGPVFDGGGQLIGIAVSDAAAGDRLVLASHLRQHITEAPRDIALPAVAAPMAVDEIYERGLKSTVQVIIVPKGG